MVSHEKLSWMLRNGSSSVLQAFLELTRAPDMFMFRDTVSLTGFPRVRAVAIGDRNRLDQPLQWGQIKRSERPGIIVIARMEVT